MFITPQIYLLMMGNLSLGSTNRTFNSTKLVSSFRIEVTPLTFIPLRAETQGATEFPTYFSFGMALETIPFDLSMANQFIQKFFYKILLSQRL